MHYEKKNVYFNQENQKKSFSNKKSKLNNKFNLVTEKKDFIKHKSYTSFGKLILADEKNNPIYSK